MYKPGMVVEFMYLAGETTTGTIVSYDEESEKAVIEDELGVRWSGFADWIVEIIEEGGGDAVQ